MRLPNRTVSASIAALCLTLAAIAQTPQGTPFSADVHMKYDLGDTHQEWHGKLLVDSGHMRLDIHNPPEQTPIFLTNFATQTDDVLIAQAKAYLEHPIGDPRAVGPALAMRDLRFYDPANPCGNQKGQSCKKVGVEAINGRSCDHWQINRHDKVVNLWLDQKLHFPMKTVTDDATVALSNPKEGAQNPTQFQIPDGYRKMNMHPNPGEMPKQ